MVWCSTDGLRPSEIYYKFATNTIFLAGKKATKIMQVSVITYDLSTCVYLRIKFYDGTGIRVHLTGNFQLHDLVAMLVALEEMNSRERT